MPCGDPHPWDPSILCVQPLGHRGLHLPEFTDPQTAGWDDCCHIPGGCKLAAHVPFKPTISNRQRKILTFIRTHVELYGFPPSVREVGAHVGLSSTSSVAHQLAELERKGYLRRLSGKARAVQVTLPEEKTA